MTVDYGSIFTLDLAKRFVSDYKLPIPLYSRRWVDFEYYLCLYEDEFESYTKWRKLYDLIQSRYEGSPNKFVDDFYKRREAVVQWFHENPAQKEFTSMDMNQFAIKDRPQVTSKNIYNGNGVGKVFISVDLKKANFQAMRYVNPALVKNAQTYNEFISNFADFDYFKESKYIRQVIFGQANPKRQITVEAYLIYKVWIEFKKFFPQYSNLVSLANDEFVVELGKVHQCDVPTEERLKEFIWFIKGKLVLEITADCFLLTAKQLKTRAENKTVQTFFIKTYLDKTEEIMCLPLNYRAIATKLLRDIPLSEQDFHFPYEGYDCRFCEEFHLTDGISGTEKTTRKEETNEE